MARMKLDPPADVPYEVGVQQVEVINKLADIAMTQPYSPNTVVGMLMYATVVAASALDMQPAQLLDIVETTIDNVMTGTCDCEDCQKRDCCEPKFH